MRKKESREILRIKSINKFENSYIPIPESGCWIWVGHTELKDGYGRFYDYQTKKTFFAHRASWELFVGQIPVGGLVLHHCDTPPCVNPHHLFIGTVRDNYWDCHNKKRHSHGIKHGMSKLTEGDVRAIREDHKTNPEIAKRYGVTSTMIGYIKRHQNWRHVQ
ncbi:MAG: HNH endonuclease [Nitrospirae bacterium]|nr:HNH endonuclease [Nitrospirota bacterium]